MQKNSFIKLAGFALATALAFTGCGGGGGSEPVASGNGFAVTGGGGTTGTGGGSTGVGVTGGTFGGGGGGGGTNGTGGGTTDTGGDTGGDDGGDDGGGTTGGFLGQVAATNIQVATATPPDANLTNPTTSARILWDGTPRLVVVDGFNVGPPAAGRLLVLTDDGFVPVKIPNSGPPLQQQVLNRPFQVIAAGGNTTDTADDALFISTGFDLGSNQGRIVKVDQFTETPGGDFTARFQEFATDSNSPSFMTIVEDLGGTDFVYFSEYQSQGTPGTISRIPVAGAANKTIVISPMNFPAGLATDGQRLAICHNAGGTLGELLLYTPTAVVGSVVDPSTLTIVTPDTGTIVRPFWIDYDGNNGFFFTQGGAIPLPPGSSTSNAPVADEGRLRFLANGSTTAELVTSTGVQLGGIDAIDSNNDGTSSVVFCEMQVSQRVLRFQVDTNNIQQIADDDLTQTDSIQNSRPFFVGIVDETLPVLFSIFNPNTGASNGIFRSYAPTP